VRFTRKYEIPEQPDVNDVFKAIETLGVAGI
jgi:hypothetical protein